MNAPATAIHATHQEAVQLLSGAYWPSLFEGANPGTTSLFLEIRYPFFDLRLVKVCAGNPIFAVVRGQSGDRGCAAGSVAECHSSTCETALERRTASGNVPRGLVSWTEHLQDLRPDAPYVSNERMRQSGRTPQYRRSPVDRPIGLKYWFDHLTPSKTFLAREPHHECAQAVSP